MIRKRVDTEQGDLRVFANATEQAAIRADSAFSAPERGWQTPAGGRNNERRHAGQRINIRIRDARYSASE
jgi:hypothetical protein